MADSDSDPKAIYKEAFLAFSRDEHEVAIAGYRRSIELDPTFPQAWQGLAEAHARLNDLDAAIDAIQHAIELEPDESLFHTSLSRFLQRLGRVPEAETAMAEAARRQR